MGKTLYEKLWLNHLVKAETKSEPALLYIDRHYIHEVTSPQAFQMLADRNLSVRRPDLTFATMDHSIPTYFKSDDKYSEIENEAKQQIKKLVENCDRFGIKLFDLNHSSNGIVHVIGPELGITLPGQTIVCGDSHTSTHGAFGSLAFGIGTSEVAHVLASQTVLQRRSRTFGIEINGALKPGVTAKDIILYIIAKIGTDGGTGSVIEYFGSTIESLSMEERMTICNMSIEAGARAGLIAADDITFEYLSDKKFTPKHREWEQAIDQWRHLKSDPDAQFDQLVSIDGGDIEPMVTYGTSPEMSIAIQETIPNQQENKASLDYMRFSPGQSLKNEKVDVVFIGSCTNSRISDLRAAANVFRGRKVNHSTKTIVVPGSQAVKREAEAEGLDQIFLNAGAEWRQPGCSMCIAMNGDLVESGQLAVSTSNRNFEGRQGKGSRTILASPLSAAASAINGFVSDPREFIGGGFREEN